VETKWNDAAPVLASQWLRQSAQRARAALAVLRQRSWVAVAQSLTVWEQALDATYACQQAAARRHAAAARPDGALDAFQVEGLLDGQPVTATWTRGRLACDPALRDRAELLVDLGEEFSDAEGRPRYAASLDGPAVAVALTLVRACDRVTRLALATPAAGHRRPRSTTRPATKPRNLASGRWDS
jgi:hypothetical protein